MEKVSEVDTQPTNPESQQQQDNGNSSWGFLYGASRNFPSFDLHEPSYTFGRDAGSCSVELKEEMFGNSTKYFLHLSKKHFSITMNRELNHAVIEDYSLNGLFLNTKRLTASESSGTKRDILTNGTIIGLPGGIKAFSYIDTRCNQETKDFPTAVLEKYTMCDAIGKGASGIVYLAIEKGSTERYALKVMKKRHPNSLMGINTVNCVRNEIKIMEALDHPCVVKIKEVMDFPDRSFLVMEYMEGGTLASRIKRGCDLTETEAKFICYQLLLAVKYLHSKNVVHRDIKPDNILLTSLADEPLLKVSDFGLSKYTEEVPVSLCGTYKFLAPEVITGRGKQEYTSQVDIWSVGVILYLSLMGEFPFKEDATVVEMLEQISRGDYVRYGKKWNLLSNEAKSVIEAMLTVDPNKRATPQQLLKCQWLKDEEIKKKVKHLMSGDNPSNVLLLFSQEEEIARKKARLTIETPTTSGELDEGNDFTRNENGDDEPTEMMNSLSFQSR